MKKVEHTLVIKAENRPIINSLEPIEISTIEGIVRDFRFIDAEIRRLERELGTDVEARIVRASGEAPDYGSSTRH